MEKIVNLKDLLIQQIQDIYDAKQQLLKSLPEFRDKCSFQGLVQRFDQHIGEVKVQVERLNQVFNQLNENPEGEKCEGMEGLINEGRDVISKCEDPEVTDAAMVTVMQRVNHYEIAAYGGACSFARKLGYDDIAETLHESLVEEKETDKALADLARRSINERAMAPAV